MKRKVLAFGPYAPDGFSFGSGNYTKFDGVLAMYHDQGLTPFAFLPESAVSISPPDCLMCAHLPTMELPMI